MSLLVWTNANVKKNPAIFVERRKKAKPKIEEKNHQKNKTNSEKVSN